MRLNALAPIVLGSRPASRSERISRSWLNRARTFLTVRSDLVDVVSYVTANGSGGGEASTVPAAGEAILVIELCASSSNAIMVRASDHVAAQRDAAAEAVDDAVRATATA